MTAKNIKLFSASMINVYNMKIEINVSMAHMLFKKCVNDSFLICLGTEPLLSCIDLFI